MMIDSFPSKHPKDNPLPRLYDTTSKLLIAKTPFIQNTKRPPTIIQKMRAEYATENPSGYATSTKSHPAFQKRQAHMKLI
jgi:hypothetical protein